MIQQLNELQLESSRIKKEFLHLESNKRLFEWLKINLAEMKKEWTRSVYQIHKNMLQETLSVESNRHKAQLNELEKRLDFSKKEASGFKQENENLVTENVKIKGDIVNVQSGLKGKYE
jgi:hypothetical protein